jgi:hypothetical protein
MKTVLIHDQYLHFENYLNSPCQRLLVLLCRWSHPRLTNQHDLTLSHSQSQELELILSDETLLSSAKHSEDLDAAQDVVKRNIKTSGLPENRRAINLDNIFHEFILVLSRIPCIFLLSLSILWTSVSDFCGEDL